MTEANSSHREKTARRRREILALAFLTLVALALRVYQLDAVGLSEDESHKAQAARSYRAGDFTVNAEHPMLMKTLVTISLMAAEQWNGAVASTRPRLTISEETALRWPNALFGALTTVVLFLFARALFDPVIGWLTAALWATGINAIAFNRIAKEDTLLVFFTWLGFYFYLKAKQEGPVETVRRDRLYMLSGASFGLMLASKYFPHYLGVNALYHYLRPHDAQSNYDLGKRALAKFFIVLFLAFALANPMIFHPDTLRYMLVYVSEKTLITHHGYEMMNHLYYNNAWKWTNHTPIYFYLLYLLVKTPPALILAFLIGLILILRGPRQEGVFFLRFMLVFWIVPYSLFNAKWLRYALSAMPIVYMTAAVGISAIYRKLMTLRLGRPARLAFASAALAVFLLALAITAFENSPYYLLYVNAPGGGESRRAYYFPQDEVSEAGMREAIEFIARQAPRGSIVAQDSPGVVDVYSRRFQRADLVAVRLSDRNFDIARLPLEDPVYVVAQKGQRHFENQPWLDYLERHHKPIKEIWVGGVRTTRIYELDRMP